MKTKKGVRPNIVLIMADNHPADMLGCYGNPEIQSPQIDRLASQGIQFDQAYCVNAMCSPSRASVLTGLMPSQHGVHTWLDDRKMDRWLAEWNALDGLDTLPELLGRAGYQTALIGKYHLGRPEKPQNGFDHWVTFPRGHTLDFYGNTIIPGFHVTIIILTYASKQVIMLGGTCLSFVLFSPFSIIF